MTSTKTDSAGAPARSRRDEVVDAAIPIFLRFGYKKASMDAVAAAAGLSRQAVYLHFPSKEVLFGAVVDNLCTATGQTARAALWREDLTLAEQLLAAFDETMPHESMDLLAELLATARMLVPESVLNIDALIVGEVASRLHDALGGRRWPIPDVSLEQAAAVLQAASYGVKQQTSNRDEYLAGMKSAVGVILTAGGLDSSTTRATK